MYQSKPLVIAHRGASGVAPENTLSAFIIAAEIGVDYMELDVHQSKDGVVVTIHDEELSRTTNGTGKVIDFTFNELQKFDAGAKFSSDFTGEKIPSLEDVLKLKIPLLIEVKKEGSYYPEIEQNILKLLKKYDPEKKCIIQSFESSVLQKFFEMEPGYSYHKLVTGNIPVLPFHIDNKLKAGKITRYKEFDAINPNFHFVTKRLVNKIHNQGKKIFTWTVNEEADMKKMIRAGVDGIITDFPDKLKKNLK